MKKLFCILFCITFFTLSGCNSKSSGITAITSELNFTASIEYNKNTYEYTVEIPKPSALNMKTVLPENIKGMAFEFSDSKVTIDYNGIKYDTALSALPNGSVINFIYSVFCDADKKKENVISKNDEFYITGKTEQYEYKLYIGSTGLPIKITDEKNNITAIINNAAIKTK